MDDKILRDLWMPIKNNSKLCIHDTVHVPHAGIDDEMMVNTKFMCDVYRNLHLF